MRLTRFTDYSLLVLIYLGKHNENRVTIQQISETHNISKNHLMKVVSNLTRLKIVAAQRGPGGGIQLNRLPEDINLGDVISNTEKHLQQLNVSELSDKNETSAETRLNSYLRSALQAYVEALGRHTLADVLESNEHTGKLLKMASC